MPQSAPLLTTVPNNGLDGSRRQERVQRRERIVQALGRKVERPANRAALFMRVSKDRPYT